MSSLASHTIVPTWTMFGRLTVVCPVGLSARDAVATGVIIAPTRRVVVRGPSSGVPGGSQIGLAGPAGRVRPGIRRGPAAVPVASGAADRDAAGGVRARRAGRSGGTVHRTRRTADDQHPRPVRARRPGRTEGVVR